MTAELPRIADAVVVGGGALGTSICFRLARAGLSTVLLERNGLAAGCTGTTVALVNASAKDATPEYTALNLRSVQLYRHLSEELDADIGFDGSGNMPVVAETGGELEAARRLAARQNRVPGMHVETLDAGQTREMVPGISEGIVGALYSAQDGCVDSFRLALAQAAAASRDGAHIAVGTRVTGIVVHKGAITEVVTDRGTVATRNVVIAAGIHTPALGEMAGVSFPVMAKRGQIVTTEPLPYFLPMPVSQMRQMPGGPVIIGTTYEDVGYTRATHLPTLAALAGRAMRLFPALRGGARAMRFWAGLRPWPADGISILGQAPGVTGLYVAATHSGITLAPVVGIAMSELITEGRARVIDLAPFSPARFSSSEPPHMAGVGAASEGAAGEDFRTFWRTNRGDLGRV
jgi:glycine/D-amino acid oxidase-like deaminating enzyme